MDARMCSRFPKAATVLPSSCQKTAGPSFTGQSGGKASRSMGRQRHNRSRGLADRMGVAGCREAADEPCAVLPVRALLLA